MDAVVSNKGHATGRLRGCAEARMRPGIKHIPYPVSRRAARRLLATGLIDLRSGRGAFEGFNTIG